MKAKIKKRLKIGSGIFLLIVFIISGIWFWRKKKSENLGAIERIKPNGYDRLYYEKYGVEIFYSEAEREAKMYVGRSNKPIWWIRFRSVNDMYERINESLTNYLANRKGDEERSDIRKKINEKFKASEYFKIGDILVSSWGYEQTNVDFYQVVEVLNKKIRVAEISNKAVKYYSSMSGEVMPVKDSFLKNGETLLLSLSLDEKGQVHISKVKGHYYIHVWDGKPMYESSYA